MQDVLPLGRSARHLSQCFGACSKQATNPKGETSNLGFLVVVENGFYEEIDCWVAVKSQMCRFASLRSLFCSLARIFEKQAKSREVGAMGLC